MGAQTIPFVSGGTREYLEQGAGWKRGIIRERVAITADSSHTLLSQRLPEGAQVAWASMKNVTAVQVEYESGTTASADTISGTGGFALAINASSAVTSLSTSATTDMILRSPATVASTATFAIDVSSRGVEPNTGARQNLTDPRDTTDGGNFLFLAPAKFVTTAAAIFTFNPDTTTVTSGYTFTVAATVDVIVVFDEYSETPNNA